MNTTNPVQILAWALPIVLLASLIEALVLSWKKPGSYDWKAAAVSVTDQVLRRFMALLPLSIAAPIFAWAFEHRLMDLSLSSPAMVLLLFVGQEFCYYWYHRAAHRVRWFWATHSVHHSPNQLNLSAAYRLGITGRLTGTAVFFTPLVWLGFPPNVVIATLAINLLYQFWIHATWIPKLGWLEYVLNTPSAHRVHHASNLEYLDANYGGVLIIFDRLFGTYRAEREELPCVYGLVKPVTSYNPLVVEFGPWAALFKDLASARSVGAFFGYLLCPPGWKPNGQGETTEDLRARAHLQPPASAAQVTPAQSLASR
jgi:sterol desaturase/sphingolipid hydroxylase (fatty acid hydroxylase superfamily)